jgi:hypothetical protein
VLVAAAEAGVPWNLQSSLAQGMELGAASRMAAGSLGDRTALTSDACAWAVTTLAAALGMGSVPVGASVGGAGSAWGADADLDVTRDDTPVPDFRVTVLPAGHRRSGSGRVSALALSPRLAAAMAGIGALLIIWACALPDAYFPSGDGRQSYSIFNSGGGGALWYALEPAGVAVLVAAIAVAIVVAERSTIAGWLAPGMLMAFGIQTAFFFAGYEFSVQHPARTGAGELVGFLAAVLLLAAAGTLVTLRRPATTPPPPPW